MADYNDYLAYLHHVDDTTLQEFKKKEDELRHQIDVVRDQCKKDIRSIKENAEAEKAKLEEEHKAAIASLTAQCQSSVEKIKAEREAAVAKINAEHKNVVDTLCYQHQSLTDSLNAEIKRLKESHKRETQKVIAEKDAQILKLTNKLAQIEAQKFSFSKVINNIIEFILALFTHEDSDINDATVVSQQDIEKEVHYNEADTCLRQETERKSQNEIIRPKEDETRKTEDSTTTEVGGRFCRICGNPLKPGAVFCNKCGTKVS